MKIKRLHRMVARTAAVAMTLIATLVVTAMPAHAGYVSVNLQNKGIANFAVPGRSLAVAGTDSNYGEVRPYEWTTYGWNIRDHAPNGHTIQESQSPGLCLDSNHAGDLYAIRCNGGGYQRWDFNHVGRQRDGYWGVEWDVYEIRNRATGRCLDASWNDGYTLGCNGGNHQRWYLF